MRMTSQYRFEHFLLDPATRELRNDEGLVALPARAFDCLTYLIGHRDRAVGRDELIAAVWGRTEISDALLSHTIVKIRRALGDTGNEQRTIRTVPRFGYRWVGDLAPPSTTPPPHAAAIAPAGIDVHARLRETRPAPAARSRSRWWLRGLVLAFVVAVALSFLGMLVTRRPPARNGAPVAPAASALAAPGRDGSGCDAPA